MNKKGKFILGAGLGLGLGMLLAPKSGKETRKDLMAKCNELLNKVKNLDADEVKENITEKVTELQNEIRALDKEKVKEKAAKEVRNSAAGTLRKLADTVEDKPKKK